MTGAPGFPDCAPGQYWANHSPDLPALRRVLDARGEDPARLPDGGGRWMPFSQAQSRALRETYADDLFWLRAGADGLATLTEEDGSTHKGPIPARSDDKRGRRHDRPARILAPDG